MSKRFGTVDVLHEISFSTEPGEFVVLVGPSGCGKSTLLRMVAGLETISSGTIAANGRVLNEIEPQHRGVGMVFQSYALYPHMTVAQNLAFPLRVKRAPTDEQAKAVQEVARLLELESLLDRLPGQLSGGQRQRVAIGRCLVRKPDIYCFDEPLSNLDAALRTQIRMELKVLQRTLGKTTLYVTHDQVEAMTLADRMVVLHQGHAQQVGSPESLYARPANRFVARFIGSPSMNLLRGHVEQGVFSCGALRVPLTDTPYVVKNGPLTLGVRPEDVRLVGSSSSSASPHRADRPYRDATPAGEAFHTPDRTAHALELDRLSEAVAAVVKGVEPVGETGYLHLAVEGLTLDSSLGGSSLTNRRPGEEAPQPPAEAGTPSSPGAGSLLAAVPGIEAFRTRPGDTLHVALRLSQLHLFDATTGIRVPEAGGRA